MSFKQFFFNFCAHASNDDIYKYWVVKVSLGGSLGPKVQERESYVLAFPLPLSAKASNEFDYRSEG